jgi:Domain of unknown function (DUF4381)
MTPVATLQAAGVPATALPLRDIHLPEPISWWPLAPGWWLLLTLAVLAVVAFVLLRRWHQRKRRRQRVFEQLSLIESAWTEHRDALQLVRELSVLMRRAGISLYPRRDTASLTGDDWLAWLDGTSTHKGFSDGAGRLLAKAPYANSLDAEASDIEALIALCRNWLRANTARMNGQAT